VENKNLLIIANYVRATSWPSFWDALHYSPFSYYSSWFKKILCFCKCLQFRKISVSAETAFCGSGASLININ